MNLTQDLNITFQNFTNGNITFQNFTNRNATFTTDGTVTPGLNLARTLGVVIYLGFGSFAFLANIIVLVLVCKKSPLQRTIFDLTVCSLVVADLTASLGIVTVFTFMMTADHDTVPNSAIVVIMVFKRTSVTCFLSSVLHIVVITAERFFGLFAPFVYRRVVTKKKVMILIAIIWILTVGLAIISCVSRRDILETSQVFGSGLSSSIMYVLIGIKVLVMRRHKKRTSRRDSRILENAFAVTLSFLVCTFPSALKPFVMDYDTMFEYGFLCDSFFALKLLLDPILYYFMIYHYGGNNGMTPRGSGRGSARDSAYSYKPPEGQ